MKLGPLSLNKAHILAIIGNVVTVVVAVVPQWAPEKQAIIAALGGVVSNIYPLVNAIHAVVDVIKDLLSRKLTPEELRQNAVNILREEVTALNLQGMAQEAMSGDPARAVIRKEAQLLFAPLLAGQAPTVVVAAQDPPPVAAVVSEPPAAADTSSPVPPAPVA